MLGMKDSVVVEHGVDQIFHSPNLSWNGGRATGRWTDGVDHDPPAPRTGHILAEPSVADKLLEQQARLQSPIHVHDLLERIHVIGCRGITTGRERHACWPWTFVDCGVEGFTRWAVFAFSVCVARSIRDRFYVKCHAPQKLHADSVHLKHKLLAHTC